MNLREYIAYTTALFFYSIALYIPKTFAIFAVQIY